MFDFLDSDWFNITLQIIFVILIVFDIKKYKETKKREYIFNIVFTIAFAIWALYPYYNAYIGWEERQKVQILSHCSGDTNKTKLCKCIDNAIFKEYSYEEYKTVDKNSSKYKEFLKDAKENCIDDSWF